MTTLLKTLDAPQPAVSRPESPGDMLNALLAESRELTAVERFASAHEEGELPAQSKYYRDLIPLSQPTAGQQYAFEVDLDVCTGCKACVSACHALNGLEPAETWRSVGLLSGENGLPVIQHVTTACHHCLEPGCLEGCPTNAYEKDPQTGIVRHLDDQCFGCQYCTMACPYEVPQYSASKGIVRKCDMCHGRLAEGEAPACVQSCPTSAIRIAIVDTEQSRSTTESGQFLPASPPPQYTHPTTVFRSSHPLPADLQAGDADAVEPQHAHLPLVFMLVLTQLSVGAVTLGAAWRWLGGGLAAERCEVVGVAAGLLGLALAPLHLGRPHLAFRSVLGWRHSWLSREAVVFGLYAPMAMLTAAYGLADLFPALVAGPLQSQIGAAVRPGVELLAVALGSLGVFCSAKIYQFTKREFWLGKKTLAKFAATALVLGLSVATVCSIWTPVSSAPTLSVLITALVLAVVAKLAYETALLYPLKQQTASNRQTAVLHVGPLRKLCLARYATAFAGGIALPLFITPSLSSSWLASSLALTALVLLVLGELAERTLYFSAVIPLRMPGGLRA